MGSFLAAGVAIRNAVMRGMAGVRDTGCFFMISRFAAVVISTIFLAAVGAPAALALGEDVFVVPRVTVQAQASSATAAKDIAQQQGRRRAMDILLRRLTVEDDWVYLPRLAAGEPAPVEFGYDRGVIALDDHALEQLESGFEVYNEKSAPNTYRAFITYRFKPAAVRKLLKDAQIPYSEAQTRTALVLPVLQTGSGLYLWEDNNPWMAAWKVRPYNNELTPMTAPLGDLEDAATISARQALALNQTALQIMADRYSVSQVIVAHAFLQQHDGEDTLRVRLINGFRESGEIAPLDELGVVDGDTGAGGNFIQQGLSTMEFIPAKVGDVLAEEWFRRPSGNFPTLAEEAIETAIAKHAKPWKKRTLIDHTEAALLEASAYFNSIVEWGKIRTALVSTPLVGSIQVRSMSRRGAEMLIRAYGDPGKLIIAMEAQGLALWTEDGDRWMIATPATAQSVRGRSNGRRRNRLGILGADAPPTTPAAYEETETSAKIESEY